MTRTLIKGNTALAAELGVSRNTVQVWRREGLLKPATVVDLRRTVVYDLDKVGLCLQNHRLFKTKY